MLAASQAISFEGQTFTTRALQIGEAFAIRCDGTAFKITAHTPPLGQPQSSRHHHYGSRHAIPKGRRPVPATSFRPDTGVRDRRHHRGQ